MLGIVILNYNTYQDTFKCVESIRESSLKEYHIYIVDNCSKNDSYLKLSEYYQNDTDISVFESDYNGGFAYGNNYGFRKAISDGADLILASNSDVIFTPEAINVLIKKMDDEKIGICGPLIKNGEGIVQNCNRGYLTAKTHLFTRKPFSIFDFFGVGKKFRFTNKIFNEATCIEGMVSGCCFMIKSSVLEKIGYLDENTFLYHEEDILSIQMKENGYLVCYEPGAVIYHLESKSVGNQKSAFVRYHNFRSALYYLRKYARVSWFSFFFISKLHLSSLWVKGLTNKEYKSYYRLLKQDCKNLRRNGVLFENNIHK